MKTGFFRSKRVKDICVGDILRYYQGEILVLDIEIKKTYMRFRGLCCNGSICVWTYRTNEDIVTFDAL